jgi:hypothetical protein
VFYKELIADAAPIMGEVAQSLSEQGFPAHRMIVRYHERSVRVYPLASVQPVDATVMWTMLVAAFGEAGWGYGTQFENGINRPRTSMHFNHPSTLTRIR